jgi:chemotaxis signal transduction protein
MVTYKEQDYLMQMSDVSKFSKTFSALNDQWDNVKLLCEVNCPTQAKNILPSMANIQEGFDTLQQSLTKTLITETRNKLEQKMRSKAQAAVDILVRNLYERTADVGFLATDEDICSFVRSGEQTDTQRESIEKRLSAYAAKYSVYEEIIILNTNFTVLANLNKANSIVGQTIEDLLLKDTLDSKDGFVETFRFSVLQAQKKKAHIFSSKIVDENSQAIGIICLCFRFENEMKRIFEKLDIDYDGSVITILDNKNTVLASSDENHVPVNIHLESAEKTENAVVYYRGLEYFAKTVQTKGYQGYFGLGWKGHVMVPVKLAFKEKVSRTLNDIRPEIMTGLMEKADSFSTELQEIVMKTQAINRSLRRIVYNGQIIAKNEVLTDEEMKLRPLLSSINKIGTGTSQLFKKSNKNLFATLISTSLLDVRFLASLCIDIMDRNLYERSDDCRWWALDTTFKTILSKREISEKDLEQLTAVLSYINSLYTVYSNLFLFDKTGKIIAVSNPTRSRDIGKVLDADYIRNILGNRREEKYFVSPFAATDLYDNKHTYIYGASITDIQNSSTVGGIGIVFDSEFQFRTMLDDNMQEKEDTFAVFADRQGNVISSTNSSLQIGSRLNLPGNFFEVENGMSHSEILVYQNCYYSVGCVCSSSYREYKQNDGYQNDVLAFVFEKMAEYDDTNEAKTKNEFIEQVDITLHEKETHKKIATFVLGGQLFGLDQSVVTEVIDTCQIIDLPGCTGVMKGAIVYRDACIPVVDTHALFEQPSGAKDSPHLLLLQLEQGKIALEADALNNVLEINESDMKPVSGLNGSVSVVKGIVCFENSDRRIMIVLNHETLFQRLDSKLFQLDINEVLSSIKNQPAEAN